MLIQPDEISSDEDLARRVLVRARTIAPCIDFFPDGSEERKNAIAILKGVVAETPAAGSRRTRSMSRNGTAVTFDSAPAFDDVAESNLRSLCAGAAPRGLPRGSFPKQRITANLWPEGEYSG